MINFRDLTAEDIECRVQSCKENGLVLLLYKNARVDMNILDETVGAENWQREHYEVKGNMFCRVGIRCDNVTHTEDNNVIIRPEWVWKADCGVESNTEAQKGEASDSFKRACFNWGIGRELYTAPFIWIPADKCNINDGRNGAKQCYDKFEVEKITIQDKRITSIVIRNTKKKCVAYEFKKDEEPEPPKEYQCTDCGAKVDANMAMRTHNAFGVVLCKNCGLKRSESK